MNRNNEILSKINFLNKKEWRIFFLITIMFLLFYCIRIVNGTYNYFDSFEYLDIAKSLRNHTFIADYGIREKNFTRRPIVYPLFLALFLNLKSSLIALIQMSCVLLSIYNLFGIAKKLQIKIDYKIAVLLVFTPTIIYFSQVVFADWILFCLLNLLLYLFLLKWSNTVFLSIQIVTILLAFTKPIFYPFVYINFLFFVFYMIKIKVFSIWLFLPILTVLLFLNFNENKTGYKHFSSMESYNLGYNIYVYKKNFISSEIGANWFSETLEQSQGKTTFREEQEYVKEKSINEIKKNWLEYSIFHFERAILGIFDPGLYDIELFLGENESGKEFTKNALNGNLSFHQIKSSNFLFLLIFFIPIILVNIIKYFFLTYYIFSARHNYRTVFFLILISYYIFITGVVNMSRYMMPIQGIVILFALIGCQNFRNKLNEKQLFQNK